MRRFLYNFQTILLLTAALGLFYLLFSAFVVLARDAGAELERREVVIDLPGANAPDAEEVEETDRITIYREGDGPAPAWYDPSEPMAAEWSANAQACDSQSTDGLQSDYILNVPLDAEFQTYLHGLCEEYGVPYTLAVAVIEAESTYRADVISASGDYGLMQINRVCHEWLRSELGVNDFLDPYDNVRCGVYLLGWHYQRYGYVSGTLVAYNQGQAAAEALFAAGVYETDYSRRVISIRWRIENGGAK